MKWIVSAALVCSPAILGAKPLHNPIPDAFRGTFATALSDCDDPHGTELITVEAEGVHYYEGDDYLIIGIEFSGSSTKSRKHVPIFNGRYIGRMETQILGEVNTRMEMETPNMLIRYLVKDGGELDQKPVDTWLRCPAKGSNK